MSRAGEVASFQRAGQRGSILLLVLFVCLAIAVIIQAMALVVVCAEQEFVAEASGRASLAAKDEGLTALRARAAQAWKPLAWTMLEPSSRQVEGSISELADSDWAMQAAVRQNPSGTTVSAWLERGRDGVDLPLAAAVATSVIMASAREHAWLDVDSAAGGSAAATGVEQGASPAGAVAYLKTPPEQSLVGEGCAVEGLDAPWTLDPGWSCFARDLASRDGCAVTPGLGVMVLAGPAGRELSLADALQGHGDAGANGGAVGSAAQSPLLVLVVGGASLDAGDLRDLYAVIVVDGGSLQLDGTSLHGAAFVTKAIDVGVSGRVLFSRPTLRWATDRSLTRVRLVPGTRRETTR